MGQVCLSVAVAGIFGDGLSGCILVTRHKAASYAGILNALVLEACTCHANKHINGTQDGLCFDNVSFAQVTDLWAIAIKTLYQATAKRCCYCTLCCKGGAMLAKRSLKP